MKRITSLSVCGPTYGIGHTSRQHSLLSTAKSEGWEVSEQVIDEFDELPPRLSQICDSAFNSTCLIIDLDPRFTEAHGVELNRYLGNARLQHVRKILFEGDSDFKSKAVLNEIEFDLSIFPYGSLGVNSKGRELSGFGYSIFSKALQEIRLTKSYSVGEQQNIIVSCGGSDPLNVSGFYLDRLSQISKHNLHIKIVVGKYFSTTQIENLERFASTSTHKVELLNNPSSLVEAFAFADISFVTGGLTRNESMYSGVCTVVTDINIDQFNSTNIFSLREAVVSLGIFGSQMSASSGGVDPSCLISTLLDNRNRQKILIKNAKLCFPENGASKVLAEIGDVCQI